MTAPMTRERLAELRRAAPFPGGACDVSNYDELVDACEALLTEREAVRDSVLEEAAKVADDHCACGGAAIRALKGKR